MTLSRLHRARTNYCAPTPLSISQQFPIEKHPLRYIDGFIDHIAINSLGNLIIAVRGGMLYSVDQNNFASIRSTWIGTSCSINGLSTSIDTIFVSAGYKVLKFNSTTLEINSPPFSVSSEQPHDLALDQKNRLLIATETGFPQYDFNINIFTQQGMPLGSLGTEVLKTPISVCVNSQGHILIGDARDKTINVFQEDQFLYRFNTSIRPQFLTTDNQDRVIVAYNNQLEIFASDGSVFSTLDLSNQIGNAFVKGIVTNNYGQVLCGLNKELLIITYAAPRPGKNPYSHIPYNPNNL